MRIVRFKENVEHVLLRYKKEIVCPLQQWILPQRHEIRTSRQDTFVWVSLCSYKRRALLGITLFQGHYFIGRSIDG